LKSGDLKMKKQDASEADECKKGKRNYVVLRRRNYECPAASCLTHAHHGGYVKTASRVPLLAHHDVAELMKDKET
jgi:hypothetical protein